ncbi:MFS transporter [Gulosibacter sp. 10]|uniref:MFS transporter n=1 Tax=Gulosibacter sp. 10 TaxID=1255570 RepID=UPI00097E7897|nr:MFS transporter [Gulosibacter sp. 10]SJM65198.1 Putative transport protein/putative regulator [Gulosibacter sp. 10]
MEFTPHVRRNAVFALFMIPGLALSTWVTRTPDIRDLVGASTAEMGLILFGLSIGSMIGVLCSAPLVRRFGTRSVIGAGTTLVVAGLAGIGLAAALASGPLVAAALMLFGLGMGGGEVAINVEGADVERALRRPAMPAMHGMFSVAVTIGASLGILGNALRVPIAVHTAVLAAVSALVLVAALRRVPPGTGRAGRNSMPGGSRSLLRERALLLIGVVVLAMAFTEGAANDWLPLILVDGHGFSATAGALAYAGFAAAMAIGRFAAGPLLRRFSRAAVVRSSALAGAVGLVLVIFAEWPPAVLFAVLLWGLGASVGFPVAMSAAGDSGPDPTARVSLVATVGYIAFLVGPPALGFLGEAFGLRPTMLVIVALLGLAFLAASAVGRGRKD